MKLRALILICSPLLLAGCTSSTKISKLDPFYNYVGQTVELRKPADIVTRRGIWFGSYGVMSRHSADYGLIDAGGGQGRGGYGHVIAELPVGHKVQIDSVWDEVVVDEEQIIAYGHTTIPPSTKEVSFAYPWGEFWILWPAPWEPSDTPEKRGPPGRLPPHFDYDMFKAPAGTPEWGTKVKQ
ncbi:MAG TPA: hypothetical protein VMA13_04715 [Candidatus Saccharimonadales bacterium]|nr:hypothetical protein [Candidatus Saccharimonadales bacterium]